ncbi:flagellar basal body-associated protein FliL [Pseudorhodobacter sp. E13]|uniref:flagellar basal body-associated FliL family protein n=1 Tax=Pseudorhodobacter sp. E13 TaxID=2487931 RepID=UPI000F8E8D2E|nr:flagellar basal body-associated FliL family protein [Pseudorhodobacter sp. E13]RUS59757.1 flagellar basal body-associated protein FliL [Pseudorhodobacter sp. E13]
MKKLIPVFLVLFGLGAGVGAGVMLRPASEEVEPDPQHVEEAPAVTEFVKLNNQFVVPVVEDGRVISLVILALSVEVSIGSTEAVFAKEPKLRDALLQVLFDHANAGGFKGVFTDGANLILLRKALLEAAQKTMGALVTDVLISNIARQDT